MMIRQSNSSEKHNADKAVFQQCPNCWGHQTYGGDFFHKVNTKNVDTNNLEEKRGWILAYTGKYLTGTKLQPRTSGFVCVTCHKVNEKRKG